MLIAVPLIIVGKKARYNVMLDPSVVSGVDQAARTAGVSRSEYISKVLGESLRHTLGVQYARGARASAASALQVKSKEGTSRAVASAASVLSQGKSKDGAPRTAKPQRKKSA